MSAAKSHEVIKLSKPKEASSEVTVVLLGWFGAKQKHLQKYADWYTQRGINAVTFNLPISDILRFRAEQHILKLEKQLNQYVKEPAPSGKEKQLIIHAFSNTGWLSYGVMLERWLKRKDTVMLNSIKGCVFDSAPSAEPDPTVYTAGLSTGLVASERSKQLLGAALSPVVSSILQHPRIKSRIEQVTDVLTYKQPKSCPQLYFYSSADRIIPSRSIEAFMYKQAAMDRSVQGADFETSPHVDHLRHFPRAYTTLLEGFIRNYVK